MARADLRWPRGLDALCYGGDYNPEQWPAEIWDEDIALMRAAGVNLVSLGVFAWSRLEPAEGRYDFGWLDRVLDLLAGGGIRAALATPTASPPPWFSLAHPDALPVTAAGVRLSHGSRDTYCASAPAYRAACRRIAAELGRRYAGHPALALWHVHNEYGTWCHCAHTARAFRAWLVRRYGSLDALNDAWTTAFWSQHYGDWAQIRPPVATQYLANPAQVLDFRRFLSDELLDCYREQRDVLRALAPDVPATTNFVFGGWVPVENWAWAEEVDLVTIDHYPSTADLGAEEQTALAADLARSWARGAGGTGPHRPWLLIEQAAGGLHVDGRVIAKEPGRYARLSMSHVARGSRGAMSFQWRASRGGAELWHPAMVPHAGPDTRIFREVVALGETLRTLSATLGEGVVEARVAIVWDAQSWWALDAAHAPSGDLDYLAAIRAVHRTLWRQGITVDFVSPQAELSAYSLVLLPSLYSVSDTAAAALRDYVTAGGSVAVWYFSGITDESGRVRLGGYPGAFRELLGVRVEEFHPLPPGASLPLSTGELVSGWTEHLHAVGARVLACYAAGPLAGLPAITRNAVGAGTAWYVSTSLDEPGLSRLLAQVCAAAGVTPVVAGLPAGVEVIRRRSARASWLFVLNHTDAEHLVPADGVDVLSGTVVAGTLRVPAGGFAVVRGDSGAPGAPGAPLSSE